MTRPRKPITPAQCRVTFALFRKGAHVGTTTVRAHDLMTGWAALMDEANRRCLSFDRAEATALWNDATGTVTELNNPATA